jgi:hypothetical protein
MSSLKILRSQRLFRSLLRSEDDPPLPLPLVTLIVSLFQWVQRTISQSQTPSEPPSLALIRNCLSVLSFYLQLLQSRSLHAHLSKNSHIKSSSPSASASISSDSCLTRLTDHQWNEILHWNTHLLSSSPFLSPLPTHSLSDLRALSLPLLKHSSLFIQAIFQLHCFHLLPSTQSYLSGFHNIWIVKAPEASKGTNIKLFSSLSEILLYEKGMSGRIVQKYIERPLLIPLSRFILPPLPLSSSSATLPSQSNRKGRVKFDLRIWVLLTSLHCDSPPRVYLYKEVYGRRCSSFYSLSSESLSDSYKHLTNYSIQKGRVKDDDGPQTARQTEPSAEASIAEGEAGDEVEVTLPAGNW